MKNIFKGFSYLIPILLLFSCEGKVEVIENSIISLSIKEITVDGERCTVVGNVEWKKDEEGILLVQLSNGIFRGGVNSYSEFVHTKNGEFSVTFEEVYPNQQCIISIEDIGSSEKYKIQSEPFLSSMYFIMDRVEYDEQDKAYHIFAGIDEAIISCVPFQRNACTVTFFIEDMSGNLVWRGVNQGEFSSNMSYWLEKSKLSPKTQYSCYCIVEPYNYPICVTSPITFETVE